MNALRTSASAGRRLLRAFLRDESATTAVEYGLVTAFIALATIATLLALEEDLEAYFMTLRGN